MGAVVTRSDLEVKATNFSAVVRVFDTEVGDRNFAVHNFEVIFICDPDPLIGQFLIGIDPRQLAVQLLLKLVVENDSANLAARILNLSGNLMIKAVKIRVVAGFLSFDQAVINRLPMGN